MTDVIYGTQEQVATMASTWTRAGKWVDPVDAVPAVPPDPEVPGDTGTPAVLAVKGTNPTKTEVETWLSNLTAEMNLALQNTYFITPIDETASPNAFKSVSQYVVQLVADLCNFKNSSGRFFSERLVERGVTPMAAILKDMNNWVAEHERGLIADHVPQQPVPVVTNQMQIRLMGSFPSRSRR